MFGKPQKRSFTGGQRGPAQTNRRETMIPYRLKWPKTVKNDPFGPPQPPRHPAYKKTAGDRPPLKTTKNDQNDRFWAVSDGFPLQISLPHPQKIPQKLLKKLLSKPTQKSQFYILWHVAIKSRSKNWLFESLLISQMGFIKFGCGVGFVCLFLQNKNKKIKILPPKIKSKISSQSSPKKLLLKKSSSLKIPKSPLNKKLSIFSRSSSSKSSFSTLNKFECQNFQQFQIQTIKT